MATKKQKTFAKRAKELISRYPKADFDKIEKDELQQKLAELAEEQEAYKKANNIDGAENNKYAGEDQSIGQPMGQEMQQPMQQPMGMPIQGEQPSNAQPMPRLQQQFGDGGSFGNQYQGLNNYSMGVGLSNNFNNSLPFQTQFDSPDVFSQGIGGGRPAMDMDAGMGGGSGFQMPQISSFIPSLVGAGISMWGAKKGRDRAEQNTTDLLDSIKDPTRAKSANIAAQTINLGSARSQMKKDASNSKNAANRNIRNTARTRGEYLSNVNASSTDIDRVLGRQISASNLDESRYNAGANMQAATFNANQQSQTSQFNANSQNRVDQMRLGVQSQGNAQYNQYADQMYNIPQQAMNDMMKIKQQQDMMQMMGRDYKMQNTNDKWWQMPKYVPTYVGRGYQQ